MNLSGFLRQHLKKSSRIYILPTRMGGYLNGLIFLMFLLAIGYNNNLLLIFTLFLFALNLMWVIQTHFYLKTLRYDSVYLDDGHSGEELSIQVNWKETPKGIKNWEMVIENDLDRFNLSRPDHTGHFSRAMFQIQSRGVIHLKHLLVRTEMPFGLYRVWTYFPMKAEVWVYPARLKEVPLPLQETSLKEGDYGSREKGPHDVWNVAPYNQGEARRISWKHYARTGELFIKEGEELHSAQVLFRVLPYHSDIEQHLSIIATQMVQCFQAEVLFGLEAPEKSLPMGTGDLHLRNCLRVLATC